MPVQLNAEQGKKNTLPCANALVSKGGKVAQQLHPDDVQLPFQMSELKG